jgi:hypothetical protein
MMAVHLNKNTDLLLVYFNVMILSKAFKLDKLLQTSSHNNNYTRLDSTSSSRHHQPVNPQGSNPSEPHQSTSTGSRKKLTSSLSGVLKKGKSRRGDEFYEGDGELTSAEVFGEMVSGVMVGGVGLAASAAGTKYDLILFPRVLELCIGYIISVRQQQKIDMIMIFSSQSSTDEDDSRLEKFDQKYAGFNAAIEQFFKRLLYLLESCNLNVQIMLNNVSHNKLL